MLTDEAGATATPIMAKRRHAMLTLAKSMWKAALPPGAGDEHAGRVGLLWYTAVMAELYAILDWPHAGGLDVVAAARGLLGARPEGPGPRYLQLRCKGADTSTRIDLLEQVGPLCLAAGVPLIVNDDLEAALARPTLARGVHLGQGDLRGFGDLAAVRARVGRDFIVGVSTHDLEQVRASAALPVDYIGFGPVQATRSKLLPEPVVGFDELRAACGTSPRPVVAIGGLDAAGASRARDCGATMVAVIGALVAASTAEIHDRVVALTRALAAS